MKRFVALTICVASLVAATAAWSAEVAHNITIRAREFIDAEKGGARRVAVSGTIASNAVGEIVDVLAKECGPNYRHYRVVAGTQTEAGGSWRLVTSTSWAGVDWIDVPLNAYYRARWRGHLSEAVLNQIPATVYAFWRPRLRRVDVRVSSGHTGLNLRGKFVELQRKLAGTDSWVRVRRARLGRGTFERYAGQQFRTRFAVTTRGLTLRVLVPAETGAPCYSAGVSDTWRS
jgi:hypothetical protein